MPRHRHVVLLVDDDTDALESMAVVIELTGADAITADSAAIALARLRLGLHCCLVVLDWRMPGMSGRQFYAECAADPRLASIPLLVVTGDPRAVCEARGLGIQYAELKPIDPDRLVEIVREHCTETGAGLRLVGPPKTSET
jgi:two-component system response regulator FlrC